MDGSAVLSVSLWIWAGKNTRDRVNHVSILDQARVSYHGYLGTVVASMMMMMITINQNSYAPNMQKTERIVEDREERGKREEAGSKRSEVVANRHRKNRMYVM